ncbi:integrase [Sphingobium fontiphilum]|uniref:Integrase n=1 Tax=Sphingobium fontiphilum TaxID=944425 RepID=A0A7W6DIA0_9SPHN|nr:site-specific integrase [Sphingobium fontiphilum]MBB3983109.1 integrase [Sphingobium fontiphilum]
MPLATVLIRYWDRHGANVASHDTQRFALKLWNEFWGEATVADLSIPRQREFRTWLKARDYKNSYVDRILSVGRAALNLAWKWGEITSPPFIEHVSDRSDAKEAYRLKKSEMRRFLSAVQEWPHLYTFSMLMLNTLGRPEAVLDLAPAQVDLEYRSINLNPKGRKQTKKYRPTVPITDTLMPFVFDRKVVRFVTWRDKPIRSVKKTFARAVKNAGLSADITPYSLRHTMAAELRGRGVPAWEVEGLLGHRRPGVTESYAVFSPDYLSAGRAAIDGYFADLGMELPRVSANCVPVACQPKPFTIPRTEVM